MDGQLDIPFVGLLEQMNEKSRFVRVDSDVVDNLVRKEDAKDSELTTEEREIATTLFKSQIPAIEKSEFMVTYAAMAPTAQPVVITQSEYMRRMKDMAVFQPGMSFYGEFPDAYNFTLNTSHPVIKRVVDQALAAVKDELKPIDDELAATNAVIKAIRDLDKDNKGVPEDKKDDLKKNEDKAQALRDKKEEIVTNYAAGQDTVKQLIDIALLGNGLLKGEALNNFLKRSVDLL